VVSAKVISVKRKGSISLSTPLGKAKAEMCTLAFWNYQASTEFQKQLAISPDGADLGSRSMSRFDFATTIQGKMYQGQFTVTREGVTVTSEYGKKTIQVGRTPPKVLARMILSEIVSDDLRRRGLTHD
jgi:hypothetical protein